MTLTAIPQGDYDGAKPLYERSLEIWKKVLGEEHHDVAQSLNNLALLLWRMNRRDEAIPYQERATAIRERRGEVEKHAEYRRELESLKVGENYPY